MKLLLVFEKQNSEKFVTNRTKSDAKSSLIPIEFEKKFLKKIGI